MHRRLLPRVFAVVLAQLKHLGWLEHYFPLVGELVGWFQTSWEEHLEHPVMWEERLHQKHEGNRVLVEWPAPLVAGPVPLFLWGLRVCLWQDMPQKSPGGCCIPQSAHKVSCASSWFCEDRLARDLVL